ncbi:MAG: ribosome small subunit-dependent GTPase A [Bacteroidota bacterium]
MARKAPRIDPATLTDGTVIRSVGSSHRVQISSGESFDCIVRGKFRIKNLKTTNPVAVGDEVRFLKPEKEDEPGVIYELLPRKNYMLRQAIGHRHKVHILAANVDQAILLFTLSQPATSFGFADRFLLTTETYHIPTVILINKIDLLTTPEELAQLAAVKELYEKIGYTVLAVSAHEERYQDEITALLKDKRSFIGGHSGSGKSTLINLVDPDLDIKTSAVSDYTQKGKHTTVYAEMHPLSIGGYIIDTPGIKELGVVNLEQHEISHYFPDMRLLLPDCRFNDCLHIKEPGCAVLAALEAGEFAPSRYESYLKIMNDVGEEKRW